MAKTMTWTAHPSIKTENGNLRLNVLANLKKDPSLPKHLVDGKVVLRGNKTMTVEEYMNQSDDMSLYRQTSYSEPSIGARVTFWNKAANWFREVFMKRDVPPDTFAKAREMLKSHVIADDVERTAVKLKMLIKKTYENGQVALAKRLENEHMNVVNEIVLVKNGFSSYLSESDVIELLKVSDRGIRIDFFNDYPEFVPDDVIELKKKADSLCVFDNWCVMHYDPNGSALKQMMAEEWRRDPILFGMIIGSDRLYYVKDWKTDKDDLTLDKVCSALKIEKLRDALDYGGEGHNINSIVLNMDECVQNDPNY